MDTRKPESLEAIRRVAAGKVEKARQHLDALLDRVQSAAKRPDLLEHAMEELAATQAELERTVSRLLQQAETLEAMAERSAADAAQFEGLFNFAPDDYYVYTDIGGLITRANRAFVAFLHIQEIHLLGKSLATFVAPEHRHAFVAKLDSLRTDGEVTMWETALQPRRRSPIPVEIAAGATLKPDGTVTGFRWLIRDRTEQQRAQTALMDSERFLRLAEEAGNVGSYAWDVTSGQVRLSPQLQRLYALDGFDGRHATWADRVHPKDASWLRAQVEAAFAGRQPVLRQEFRILRPDGSVRWVEARSHATYDVEGWPRRVIGVQVDITERKQAEEALAAQRQLYETILTQAAEGIIVRDAGGRITFANAVAKRRAWVPADSVTLNDGEKIWGETRDAQGRRLPVQRWPITRALQGETVTGVELYRTDPKGNPYVILTSTTPLRDGVGTIIGAASIQADITERKRAEDALRRSEQRVTDILASITDCHCKLDGEWRVTGVNDQALRYFGMPREAFLGANLWEIFPAAQGSWIEQQLRRAMTGRVPVHFEIRSYVVDRWAEMHAYPSEDGLAIYFRDITERKADEQALATQKALLETVVEQAGDPIVVVDPRGIVLLANSAFRGLIGQDPCGKPLKVAMGEWEPTHDKEGRVIPFENSALNRALRGEAVLGQQRRRRRPDGSIYDFLISATPIHSGGKEIIGAVAQLTDITAEKLTEAQLRAALADKETLLREVHHRTKNNLQMICSLLELQADAIESPEGKAALEYSSNRIYAIARLYEQLYRAMSSGQVNLCDYLRGLAEAFQETSRDTSSAAITLKMRDAQISLDVDRAVPCGLIVNELLTNAAKHAFAPGGTGEIGIAVEEMGDRIQLYVWDNGRGLPAGVDVEHSSSLGLRLVAILARRLKAEVKVDSNQGTAFTFTFPSAPES